MKKAWNYFRNFCVILVLGFISYQLFKTYKPVLASNFEHSLPNIEEEMTFGFMTVTPTPEIKKEKSGNRFKITLQQGSRSLYLLPTDLAFIEKEGKKVRFFTAAKKIQPMNISLKEVWETIELSGNASQFFHIKSKIINLDKIVEINTINKSVHVRGNNYQLKLTLAGAVDTTLYIPNDYRLKIEEKITQLSQEQYFH